MPKKLEPSGARGHYQELTWAPAAAGARKAERSPRRYRAWIPAEVADYEPALPTATAALCERGGAEVRRLNVDPAALLALEGLGRQLLRSAALASSQLEGLRTSHRKLAEAEFADLANYRAREIVGTVRAMERALETASDDEPFTVASIEAIHREVAVVPPLDKTAGQLRDGPGWIGGVDPSHAEYVGPPAKRGRPLLEDLCRFIERGGISPVAPAAV